MLIAIVVVVWPFIAIYITYQSLILSVSFICLLVFYWLTSMHGHLFPLLSTIVARYPLSWTELMLGMASHHQLFAVVFVNSLMLPTPSLESTKFAGHQEATVCPNFALWLFGLLGYCKKKNSSSLREPLRPEATERSLAPIQMYSAVFFAVADASLQPYFFINVIISSGFSLFNSRIWYGLFGLVVFDMVTLG